MLFLKYHCIFREILKLLEDDKGTEVEVPFNKENLKNLLEIPFLSLYLVKSFYEGQTGKKLKNLEGQSTIS